MLNRLFRTKKAEENRDQILQPFLDKAHEAVKKDEFEKAVAFLTRGIELSPVSLKLYLKRAQIYQYGCQRYDKALADYRHILRTRGEQADDPMVRACKQGMKEMMEATSNVS